MRKDDDTFVVEGVRAVESILQSSLTIRALIRFRDSEAKGISRIEDTARGRGIEVRHVDEHNARKYVSTKTPQGIAAIVARPSPLDIPVVLENARRLLILDGLADPGNVGTLIRTAWLLGWDACCATPSTASFYGEKAVRASAGAVGFISLFTSTAHKLQEQLTKPQWHVLLATPGVLNSGEKRAEKLALVLGGEAHGHLSLWPTARPVGIPIRKSPVDSLGVVAGGAILLEKFRLV